MIAGKELPPFKILLAPPAILAGIGIPREEEGVRDLAAKALRHMNKPDQTDHERKRQGGALRPEATHLVSLHDLRLFL
jgi:hypothetical protein